MVTISTVFSDISFNALIQGNIKQVKAILAV